MENKLIIQSSELFKDIETLESFLELQRIFPNIKQSWITKFSKELIKINVPSTWNFQKKWDGGVWFLSSESKKEKSLSLWIENEQFSLWADQNQFKIDIIKELINQEEFVALKEQFIESEITAGREAYIFKEKDSFQYESISLDSNLFAWVAGNYPQVIVNQLDEKLQNFFTPEITAMFQKINDAARIVQ
jgi:hypothetical protein